MPDSSNPIRVLAFSLISLSILTCSAQADDGVKAFARDGDLVIENRVVSFHFDSTNGSLKSVRHNGSGRLVTLGKDAVAIAKVWLGEGDNLDAGMAVVSALSNQRAVYRIASYAGETAIELNWPNLHDANGNPTGIAVHQTCELEDGAEFLRIRTRVVNGGSLSVTGLFLGLDGIELGGDSSSEVLSIPNGTMITDPQKQSARKIMSAITCRWMDLSNGATGLGTGYLDRQGLDFMAEAEFAGGKTKLGWRMFRHQGGWPFMEKVNGPLQVYPLRPGEEFTTDDWFISLHSGDWHRTAQVYRREYERVFNGDYLTWNDVSPAVKAADVIIADSAAWGVLKGPNNVHDMSKGEVRHKFLEIPGRVDKTIKTIDANPGNTLVVMLGQTTHWGIYKLPDYFPACAEAGGQADFEEMIRRLRKDIGVAGTHFYAHAVFNHPDADHYVAKAETGLDENLYASFDHIGRVACTDSDEWFQLWKSYIIPGFVKSGATGIEFDEGAMHHLICLRPEHKHGNSSVSVLTAQTRGQLRIYREFRKQLGADGYLESEGGNDVIARHFDLWETGGKGKMELVRYTHPDRLITIFASDNDDVCRAYVYGCPFLRYIDKFDEAFIPTARMFVARRAEMRRERAPGYPNGFRDDDGLTVTGGDILAKVYAEGTGATVAYYAKTEGQYMIEVDGRALGIAGLRTQKRTVDLHKDEIGYLVFEPDAH